MKSTSITGHVVFWSTGLMFSTTDLEPLEVLTI